MTGKKEWAALAMTGKKEWAAFAMTGKKEWAAFAMTAGATSTQAASLGYLQRRERFGQR